MFKNIPHIENRINALKTKGEEKNSKLIKKQMRRMRKLSAGE